MSARRFWSGRFAASAAFVAVIASAAAALPLPSLGVDATATVSGLARPSSSAGCDRWVAGSRIAVLYPQVNPVDTGSPVGGFRDNPSGCWDFWGYTRLFPSTGIYATNAAPQMLAVRAMIAALQRP